MAIDSTKLLVAVKAYSRGNALPLDASSVHETLAAAQTQKILDALAQNKIESLQAQVSELKTQNMFCGVPRISPYGYGVVPNFATPCGCGCNGATF